MKVSFKTKTLIYEMQEELHSHLYGKSPQYVSFIRSSLLHSTAIVPVLHLQNMFLQHLYLHLNLLMQIKVCSPAGGVCGEANWIESNSVLTRN